jgi:uncharacterized membrane-anchored protein YhcB (DUF1043 family)
MGKEKYWNGFIFGLFIGGIIGMIILELVQRGML